MNNHNLPAIPPISYRGNLSADFTPTALSRWEMDLRAAAEDGDNTISIFGSIGEGFFTEGVTVKRISAALRGIGSTKDVTVNINSPGGDVFEGIAIYNAFREHKGKVTMKILGVAASIASIIAMAGDRVEIPKSGFLMIHNATVVAMGDRHDLIEIANVMESFDKVFASIYATRAKLDDKTIGKMMDKETWMGGDEAIEKGFADALLPADQVKKEPKAATDVEINAAAKLHTFLAKAGVSRSERSKLLSAYKSGMLNAADVATLNAGADEGLLSLLSKIQIT